MQAFSKAQFSALAFAAHAFIVLSCKKQTSRVVAAKLKKRAAAVKSKSKRAAVKSQKADSEAKAKPPLAVEYQFASRDKHGDIHWKAFSDSQAAIITKNLAEGQLQ